MQFGKSQALLGPGSPIQPGFCWLRRPPVTKLGGSSASLSLLRPWTYPVFLFLHRWPCSLSLSGQCSQPQLPLGTSSHSGAPQQPRAALGMEASEVSVLWGGVLPHSSPHPSLTPFWASVFSVLQWAGGDGAWPPHHPYPTQWNWGQGPWMTLTPAYPLAPGLPGARENMRAPLLPRDGRCWLGCWGHNEGKRKARAAKLMNFLPQIELVPRGFLGPPVPRETLAAEAQWG